MKCVVGLVWPFLEFGCVELRQISLFYCIAECLSRRWSLCLDESESGVRGKWKADDVYIYGWSSE